VGAAEATAVAVGVADTEEEAAEEAVGAEDATSAEKKAISLASAPAAVGEGTAAADTVPAEGAIEQKD